MDRRAFVGTLALLAAPLAAAAQPVSQVPRIGWLQHRLPAVYPEIDFAAAGGLMAYGTNVTDNFRRAAAYVDKILKGARAADLPVEQPTKFELVINLKAARALGLTIPPAVLQRADHMIE